MRLRSLAAPSAAALLAASCTALFLPTEERVPASMELAPREIVVRDQETLPLSLILLDQYGEPFEEIPEALRVEWSLSDPALASLKPGEVKGEVPGEGWVTARTGDLVATSRLTVLGVARHLRAGGETRLQGVVGKALPAPVAVRVVDRRGVAVADVPVRFEITAGEGSLSAPGGTSDADGWVRTLWTLGPVAGENALAATSDSLAGEEVLFTALAGADGVARLEKVSGDAQQGTVDAALAQDLAVRAFDRHGNPVPGAAVAWSASGGSVARMAAATDPDGFALARWTLDTAAGPATATARVGGVEARFSATALPGPAARLRAVSGSGQSAPEGYPLPDSLVVRVTDRHDNPVAGVPVAWQVTLGGGSVAAPAQATRADGTVRAAWRMGISLPNAVQAAAVGETVSFSALPRPMVPRDTLHTGSGLRYMEVSLSTDSVIVAPGQIVSVFFAAYRADGFLLERIRDGADPPLRFEVGSGQVIPGFDEGVVGMRRGSVRRLFIPPELGYGDRTVGHIPPGTTLVFDVHVDEVLETRTETTSPEP